MRWFHSNTCLQRIEQKTQQAPGHGVLSSFPVDSKYLYKLTRKKFCPNLHNLSISIYSHFGNYKTVKHIYLFLVQSYNILLLCDHFPHSNIFCHKLSVQFSSVQSLSRVQLFAAAKSLQSCPTLCDHIDGSPPGYPVLGILQATTLEWVAISFSNA